MEVRWKKDDVALHTEEVRRMKGDVVLHTVEVRWKKDDVALHTVEVRRMKGKAPQPQTLKLQNRRRRHIVLQPSTLILTFATP